MSPPIDWKNDPEYMELINFLIEKTKDAKSPLNLTQLAEEFKESSGVSQEVGSLVAKIQRFRPKIRRIDFIDTAAKVKMLLALSAPINEDFLKELQEDADVEVDEYNRIIKYSAKDGSLELEGEHSKSAKIKDGLNRKKAGNEKSEDDSVDGSQDSIRKAPGSTKRTAPEVPNSSKRTRDSSLARYIKKEDYTDDDSLQIPAPEATAAPVVTSDDAPVAQGAPKKPKPEATESLETSTLEKTGADNAFTPQIKILEAIQSIVLNLDTPSLSLIQEKIEKKLINPSNEKIPNHEIILAMEVLVTITTKNSVPFLTENVESISLKELLCYLKAAILTSKSEGLESLLEKITGKIRELPLKDKNIPVEKVASALQTTLDVIGF